MQYQPTWIKLYFTHHTRKVSEIICKPLELTELETWDTSQFSLWQPEMEQLSCWAEIRADTITRSFTWNKSPGVLKASLHITLQARALTWLWHSEHPHPSMLKPLRWPALPDSLDTLHRILAWLYLDHSPTLTPTHLSLQSWPWQGFGVLNNNNLTATHIPVTFPSHPDSFTLLSLPSLSGKLETDTRFMPATYYRN